MSSQHAQTLVVAYEPVWAIGTGRVASAADAQEVCAAIRHALAGKYGDTIAAGVRVLYGGSVKPATSARSSAQPDVDGALVGGASLDADEFAQLCAIAAGGPLPVDPREIAPVTPMPVPSPGTSVPTPGAPVRRTAGTLALPGVRNEDGMQLALQIVLIVSSVLLVLLILLHRGRGGGLSTLFGGGVQSSLSGSSVVEKNLDRMTLFVAAIWVIAIIGTGLLVKAGG